MVRMMGRLIAVLGVFALVAEVFAAVPAVGADEPAVSGVVTVQGEPPARGSVVLFAPDAKGQWEAVSRAPTRKDKGGSFVLPIPDSLERGTPLVVAFTAEGGLAEFYRDSDAPQTATRVRPGDQLSADLERLPPITGKVTSGGVPQEGVEVALLHTVQGVPQVVAVEQTNSAGEYAVFPSGWLPADTRYHVRFEANGLQAEYFDDAAATQDRPERESATGTDEPQDAVYLVPQRARTVVAGGRADADLAPAASISGTVTAAEGHADGVEIALYSMSTAGDWEVHQVVAAEADASGRAPFRMFLPDPSAQYLVSARQDGYPERFYGDATATSAAVAVGKDAVADILVKGAPAVQSSIALRGTAGRVRSGAPELQVVQAGATSAIAASRPAAGTPGAVPMALGASVPMSGGSKDLLGEESQWRYRNSGGDPGANWFRPDYDDRSWASGRSAFGHGESVSTDIGAARPVAYFRGAFDVASVAALDKVRLTLFVDDGSVVYLNGTEILRTNVADGKVGHGTFASSLDNWDGQRRTEVVVPTTLLREGRNVLAASLHQAGSRNWISSDSYFSAYLSATVLGEPPSPPQAAAATAADQSAVVSWDPPATDGGAEITGFTVASTPDGRTCSTTGGQSCTVENLSNGTSYTFTVTATNAFGTSNPSAPSGAVTPQAPIVGDLVTSQTLWRYDNRGRDRGKAWLGVDYDDSGWQSGTSTFGTQRPVATDIGRTRPTAYFRASFAVPSPDALDDLVLSIKSDDGAVAYLNGTEIHRYNMPGGSVSFGTQAAGVDNYDGTRQIEVDVPVRLLRAGDNVLAVSLHQAATPGWVSGDSLFSATLRAEVVGDRARTPGAPRTVAAVAADRAATVSWEPPESDGGSPITDYLVQAEPGGKQCTTTGETSCTVDGLANGTDYTFTVVASNAAGTGPVSAPSGAVRPNVPAPSGWRLLYADEFDGSELDRSRWTAYDPANGNGRYGEADRHTEHCLTADNVKVSGGYLRLTARKERLTCKPGVVTDHSSAFVASRQSNVYYPIYARYEMRARVPVGQGIFPAFWLRHRNGASVAEVDIMETFFNSDPGASTSTLHFPRTLGYNVAKQGVWLEKLPLNATQGGWHTWAVEIEPVTAGSNKKVRFRFFIDDEEILTYVNTDASSWAGIPDQSLGFDIALNIALGQSDVGPTDRHLGFMHRDNRCALERPQRSTSNPAACALERTKGKWYNPTITRAPAPDGVPDIWLAPWSRNPKATAEYQIDYVRVYTR